MKFKSLFIGGWLLFLGHASMAQKIMTLQDCIMQAHENNLTIKQQELAADLALENEKQAKYQSLPNLNGNASHRYNYGQTQAAFTFAFSDNWVRSNNFSLSSNVTLFNGMRQANTLKQATLDAERTRTDVEAAKDNITLNVAGLYLQVLFNQELLEVARNQVKVTQEQVNRISKLVDAGGAPQSVLLDVEAQLAQEELNVVNQENALNLSYLSLKQLLNMEGNAVITIAKPEISIAEIPALNSTPSAVFAMANSRLAVVKSAQLTRQSAEKSLSLARGTRSPILTFGYNLGTGYSSARTEFVEPFEKIPFNEQLSDNFFQGFGFNLSVPIFNRFGTNIAINQAKISMLQADYQLEQIQLQLRQDIEQAHADASAAYKAYQATEKSVNALQLAFQYTEQRFEVGLINPLEFNQAKNNLTVAESNLLQAKFDYLFKTKILDFYQGKPVKL